MAGVESDGHLSKGTKYGKDEIIAFNVKRHGVFGEAFFDPAIMKTLRTLVHGKRVIDIGCGVGDWCYLVAQYGSKLVVGIDIQEEMVELAKGNTSQLDTVHIQIGDAANVPYPNASFDVALSLLVTCNLSPESYAEHFNELYRILSPGGKAIILVPADSAIGKLFTKMEAEPEIVKSEIKQAVSRVPKCPTTVQVTEAFQHINGIVLASFALDNGKLFHVEQTKELTDGQPFWRRSEVMMFPNFFYSNQSTVDLIHNAGLVIDEIENCFTEDKRIAYNNTNPAIPLSQDYVEHATALIYHISKPGH